MARPGSSGLTLLEMVVVLVLLGSLLALALPSLSAPRAGSDDPLQRVLDTARRAAVRRAESLSLAVEPDGRWVVEAPGRDDPEPVLSGRIEARRAAALRVLVSPLGACWLEGGAAPDPAPFLDPVRCRLARAPIS
jgi:prepilin-type N-terminal cleavage/methylation domain-containing protein